MVRSEIGEVLGVPAVLIARPGPVLARYQFDVGTVDEGWMQRGLTHLCQHLVVGRDHALGGSPGLATTMVVAQSESPDRVAGELDGFVSRIRNPPLERLEHGRRLLLADDGHRAADANRLMLLHRFGLRSFGRDFLGERALGELGPDDVAAWLAEHFVARRAALCIEADDPHLVAALLTERLPAGLARTPRPVTSIVSTPGRLTGPVGGPMMSVVTPDSFAAAVAASAFHRTVDVSVRSIHGIGTAVRMIDIPLSPGVRYVTIGFDSTPGHIDEATNVMVRAFDELDDVALADELELVRTTGRWPLDDASWRDGAVFALAAGAPAPRPGDRVAAAQTTTVADLRAAFDGLRLTALWIVPPGQRPHPAWPDVSKRAPTIDDPITWYRPVVGLESATRVGITATALVTGTATGRSKPPAVVAAVALDDIAVLLRSGDGRRVLVADDASAHNIVPRVLRDGERLVAAIDAAVPADRHVDAGPGTGPPPAFATGAGPTAKRIVRSRRFIVSALVAVVVAAVALLPRPDRSPEPDFPDVPSGAEVAERVEDVIRADGGEFLNRPDGRFTLADCPSTVALIEQQIRCTAQSDDGQTYLVLVTVQGTAATIEQVLPVR